jgi:sulfur-oxidizing protein SoxY
MKIVVTALCIALLCGNAAAGERDPLASARWGDMRKTFFREAKVVFDQRVRVSAPAIAENPLNVPVRVDASGLDKVQEVLVFADFNPIVKALSFSPAKALPRLSFRLKLQQSSPVRAAARTADGVWHVGGAWVNTTGGGCTLPSTGSGSPLWQSRLNEVSARLWEPAEGGDRLRLSIIHPMDTGLAPGIPAFHIEELQVTGADGEELMRIQPFEPVAENPLFTIELPPGFKQERIRISGRDNNGNLIDSWVQR